MPSKKKKRPTRRKDPDPDPLALLEQIETNNLSALAAKTQAGETLSDREIAWIQSVRSKRDRRPDPEPEPGRPLFAMNQTDLAKKLGEILGVTIARTRIRKWRDKFNDAPKKMSDGREPIEAWKDFIASRGLLSGKAAAQEEDGADKRRVAEARKIEAQADFLEHKMKRARGELVDRTTEAQVWVGLMIGLRTKLVTAANGLAGRFAISKDPAKIKSQLMKAIRSSLKEASQAKFASFPCPHCRKDVRPPSN